MPDALRILLVTRDDAFADALSDLAAAGGAEVRRASHDDDLELVAYGHGPDVILVDTDEARRRHVRLATAFAAAHPAATVVLATSRPESGAGSGLPLVPKTPPETLLRRLVRVGFRRKAFKS